jgi:sarcosine oxidase subunit alpha
MIEIFVDGESAVVEEGITIAAALVNLGTARFRTSVSGSPRGPLCAMGICHECRVTIDGIRHRRACLVEAVRGMNVETGG